eukprot:785386-Amphidinium_carterae.1
MQMQSLSLLARGLFPPVLAQPGPESSTAFQSDGASVVSGLEQSMEETSSGTMTHLPKRSHFRTKEVKANFQRSCM